jgi:hypothetical protein
MQLLHGRGLHGNARRVGSSRILHVSAKGRISTDELYGEAAEADEAIAIFEGSDARSRSIATSLLVMAATHEIVAVGSRSITTDDNNPPSSGPLSLRVRMRPPVGPFPILHKLRRFIFFLMAFFILVSYYPKFGRGIWWVSPLSLSPDDAYSRLPIPPANPKDRRGHNRSQSNP